MEAFDFEAGFDFEIGQLDAVAVAMADHIRHQKICLFYGEPGAGKTTLIKSIVQHLGGNSEVVNSPTFAIMNEYSLSGDRIYHFDLYRTKSTTELLDIGMDELLDSGHYCFVEWPEKLDSLKPADTLRIYLEHTHSGSRRIRLESIK